MLRRRPSQPAQVRAESLLGRSLLAFLALIVWTVAPALHTVGCGEMHGTSAHCDCEDCPAHSETPDDAPDHDAEQCAICALASLAPSGPPAMPAALCAPAVRSDLRAVLVLDVLRAAPDVLDAPSRGPPSLPVG